MGHAALQTFGELGPELGHNEWFWSKIKHDVSAIGQTALAVRPRLFMNAVTGKVAGTMMTKEESGDVGEEAAEDGEAVEDGEADEEAGGEAG